MIKRTPCITSNYDQGDYLDNRIHILYNVKAKSIVVLSFTIKNEKLLLLIYHSSETYIHRYIF